MFNFTAFPKENDPLMTRVTFKGDILDIKDAQLEVANKQLHAIIKSKTMWSVIEYNSVFDLFGPFDRLVFVYPYLWGSGFEGFYIDKFEFTRESDGIFDLRIRFAFDLGVTRTCGSLMGYWKSRGVERRGAIGDNWRYHPTDYDQEQPNATQHRDNCTPTAPQL